MNVASQNRARAASDSLDDRRASAFVISFALFATGSVALLAMGFAMAGIN